MGNEDPTPMVSVRIGELNKLCRNKGIERIEQTQVRNAVATMGIGKGTGQAKFYSPTKKRVTPKSCVMIRRSLFPKEVLEKLDRASGVEVQLREEGEQSTEKETREGKDEEADNSKVGNEIMEAFTNTKDELEKTTKELKELKQVIEDEKYARAETEKYFAEAQREVKDYKEVVQEMKEEITNTKKELEKEIEKRRRKEQENKEMKRKMNEGNGTESGEAGSKLKSLPFIIQTTDEEPQEKRVKESKKATRQLTRDKDTCNKCCKKTVSTGHILCVKCKQWQHLKCVGLNLSEAKLKQANFLCSNCK